MDKLLFFFLYNEINFTINKLTFVNENKKVSTATFMHLMRKIIMNNKLNKTLFLSIKKKVLFNIRLLKKLISPYYLTT